MFSKTINVELINSRFEEGQQFHMIIDDFGYEDLIFALVENGIRIHFLKSKRIQIFKRHRFFDSAQSAESDADIILEDQLPDNFQEYVDRIRSQNRRNFL